MNTVAVNIRRLRQKRGWTPGELAERAGVSSVKMIESGKRRGNLGTLESIAKALGVPMSELFREAPRRAKQ